jgi:hypothetical protein
MQREDILELIRKDEWMMDIISSVREAGLPDWAIGAGFVRGKVWDYLHGYSERTPSTDIDVIYFDKNSIFVESDIEKQLTEKYPDLIFEVVNQATAHIYNNEIPYISVEDALSKWPETATAVAITENTDGNLKLLAPHGIEDLINLVVRPTPAFEKKIDVYKNRVKKKEWDKKWPKLKILSL